MQYFDNKIICDLVEERHKGIIAVLDEECLRPGEVSDATFLDKLVKAIGNHKHFVTHEMLGYEGRKTIQRDQFRLLHYAGEVTYNINGKEGGRDRGKEGKREGGGGGIKEGGKEEGGREGASEGGREGGGREDGGREEGGKMEGGRREGRREKEGESDIAA